MKKKDMPKRIYQALHLLSLLGAGIQYYVTSDPKSRNHRNTVKGELWERKPLRRFGKSLFKERSFII